MDIAVPDDGRVLASAVLAVEVDALEVTTLNRLTGDKGLGIVGEERMDVIEELVMTVQVVVGVEVGDIGKGCLGSRCLENTYYWSVMNSIAKKITILSGNTNRRKI